MDTEHQLIVRIKSFLNSTELLNSQTAQELYAAYCELNDGTAQRLVECEVLLQKKQKIEAVVLAQQAPNLFDLIDSILFPERKLLLILADLYDWKAPNAILEESVANLKKAVSEMDDLRPLLTEFRRIARTDQVKNKLHLLREIYRIDKDNPEWKLPLIEVENQYVSQLIAEAQSVIQNKDFVRLEQIYEELKNSQWVVTVPTIVLQKVEKIVLQHRAEEVQKTAAVLIDKISAAYGAYDLSALEDAIFCWQEHCKKYQYSPNENENIQFSEAYEYFSSEKERQKKKQEHQGLLDQVLSLINSAAPLPFVEKIFSQAQAFDLEIPAHIINRVTQYRQDIERERRMATFIKAMKITGTVAIIVLILTGGAIWGIQMMIEDSQSKNLHAAIKKGNIPAAQSLLKEIEKKYPKLASRPKITQAKAALNALESKEKERVDEFNRLIAELDELKKQWPPNKSLKTKIASLKKIAKTDIEKSRLNEFSDWVDDAFRRRTAEVDEKFLEKIALLKQQKDDLLALLKKKDFEQAEKLLSSLEKTHNDITELQDVSKELLTDSGDILKSVDSLRTMVKTQKTMQKEILVAKEKIISSENLTALEVALQTYEKKIDSKTNPEEDGQIKVSLQDIAYFKAILNSQSGRQTSTPEKFANFSYFAGAKFFKDYENNKSNARKELAAALDSLQKNANRQRLSFVRLQSGSSVLDLYVDSRRISATRTDGRYEITLRRIDGTRIVLSQTQSATRGRYGYSQRSSAYIDVTIGGDDTLKGYKLVYPQTFSTSAIRMSQAAHQVLIEKFFRKIHRQNNIDILTQGTEFLKEIRASKTCAPYWKMKLTSRILDSITKIDLSPDKHLSKIKDELQKIQALDNVSGDPLENKFLAEKIEIFFSTHDFSVLEKVLSQNKDIEKFYAVQQQCKLQYLGLALNIDGQLKFAINASLKNASVEVLCFDGESGKCIVVGSYDKNGFLIDKEYQNKIVGRLLFTSSTADFYRKTFADLKENKSGIDLKKITYPDFWPLNLREEVEK